MSAMESPVPARAPRGARLLALLAGGTTVLVVALPLVAGYGAVLARLARQLAATGELPAPSWWTPWPLHAARLTVLLLFALDLGLWIALVGLLPLDDLPGAPFESLRRRLRRRWLLAMTPVYPVAAALAGARLLARAGSTCAAGAWWFLPGVLGRDHGEGARAWIAGERGILAFFAAAFLLHLLVLAGPSRPRRWLARVAAALAAGTVLLATGLAVVLPLVVGAPWQAAAVARRELLASFPGLADLDPIARDDLAWNAFARTAADGPAFRGRPPWTLPPEVVALPPAPLAGLDGIAVRLVVPGDPGQAPAAMPTGMEWRIPRDGATVPLPLPRPFHGTRVLKADRGLPWSRVAAAMTRIGPGPLRIGLRPAPCGPPRALPPGHAPALVIATGPLPAGGPRGTVPLPFPPGTVLPRTPDPPRPHPGRARPGRRDPLVREQPLDVLWQQALPLPRAVPPGPSGLVRLAVPREAAWDDVARAIVAEVLAGARRVELYTVGGPEQAGSETAQARRVGGRIRLPGAERLPGVLDEGLQDAVDRLVAVQAPPEQAREGLADLGRLPPLQLLLHQLVEVDVEERVLLRVGIGPLPERPVLPVVLEDRQQAALRLGEGLPLVPSLPQAPDRRPAQLGEGPQGGGIPLPVSRAGHRRSSPSSSRTRSGSTGGGAVSLTTARLPSNSRREYRP